MITDDGTLRTFSSGATRDSVEGKLDYAGFLSPRVLRRFAEYMDKHRTQSDGTLRASNNWKKGIPTESYLSSMWRHFWDVWAIMTEEDEDVAEDVDIQEALCAMLFNVQGLLFEMLREPASLKRLVAEVQVREEIMEAQGMEYVPNTQNAFPEGARVDYPEPEGTGWVERGGDEQ